MRLSYIVINLSGIKKTSIKGHIVAAMTTVRYDFIQCTPISSWGNKYNNHKLQPTV